MATVDQRLMARLEKKLRLSKRRVQEVIQETARKNRVTRDIASFIVAGDNGISYDRYATADQMAILRNVPTNHPVVTAPPPHTTAPVRVIPAARTNARPVKTTKDNTIFVVHGRDNKLTEDIFSFLRALGLNAIEFAQAINDTAGANPNITKIVKGALKRAQGVLVIFSPDEEARLKAKHRRKGDSTKLQGQSRLNVIFEAGIALGAHPEKTLLIEVGTVRNISDIAGMHIPRLTDDAASRKELAERLRRKLKLKVNTTGDYWLKVGKFTR